MITLKGVDATQQFNIIDTFKGYINSEDKTKLNKGWMIEGSQNVLLTTRGTIRPRGGTIRLGQDDSNISPVLASFDWEKRDGVIRNLRAANGKLQFYNNSLWNDLLTGLGDYVLFRFADWWDIDELTAVLLMANNTGNLYEWSGGLTTYASSTASSITKQGTTTWAEEGFYTVNNDRGDSTTRFDITNPSGTTFRYTFDGTGTSPAITASTFAIGMKVYINAQNFSAGNKGVFTITGSGTNYFEVTNASGVVESDKTIGTGFITLQPSQVRIGTTTYTYHGGESTLTLTNVVPTVTPATAGDMILQETKIVPIANIAYNSGFQFTPAKISNIAVLKQQLYAYDNDYRFVYISKQDDYKDFSFTTPTRLVGEGALLTLDGIPRALVPQEETMYISASENQWYKTKTTLSSDNASEELSIERLKTAYSKGARSQELTTKVLNDVFFINFEPTMDSLGRLDGSAVTSQITNISDPIKNDFDYYDFTDGSMFYFKNFVYIAIPKHSIVRIYNIAKSCWEAPQILSISRFSVIDGELCGHSYISPITYKLFKGNIDNAVEGDATKGNDIEARAIFSYDNDGVRYLRKEFDQFFVEGYIKENTTLTTKILYGFDGILGSFTGTLGGKESQYVLLKKDDSSIGKVSLGKNPLGGTLTKNTSIYTSATDLNKFRIIYNTQRKAYFESTYIFESKGLDFDWEILAFGPLSILSPINNSTIKK